VAGNGRRVFCAIGVPTLCALLARQAMPGPNKAVMPPRSGIALKLSAFAAADKRKP
jgi:hypothetical protein